MTNRERSKEVGFYRRVIKSYKAKKYLSIDDRQQIALAESKIEALYNTKVTQECACNPPMGKFNTNCNIHGYVED